jgi:hypothetical protein
VFRAILSTLAVIALLGATSAAALAQQDLRSPDAQDAARADQIAAQMRAFRPPPFVTPQPSPAPPSNDTPWAVIGLSVFAALLGTAVATLHMRQPRRNTLARS